MRAKTSLSVHDTDADLYDSLKRLFGEQSGGSHRWVEIETDICLITFFAGASTEPGVLTAPPSDPSGGVPLLMVPPRAP